VPDSDTAAGEFVALLTNDTDPDAAPLTPGTKLMATVLVEPAAMVAGKLNPVALNTPPVKLAAETNTDPVPVLESVTVWLAVLPTSTLPNDRLVGDTLNNCVAIIVIVADAVFVVSATLFAVTV
jgi:hypothetical protein